MLMIMSRDTVASSRRTATRPTSARCTASASERSCTSIDGYIDSMPVTSGLGVTATVVRYYWTMRFGKPYFKRFDSRNHEDDPRHRGRMPRIRSAS